MATVTVYFPAGATVRAELAADPESRARGLSGRASVPDGTGMLFDMETEARSPFWMAGARVPLDLVFINADHRVVEVVERARPGDVSLLGATYPARYVLEVPGGWVARNGVAVGCGVVVVRSPV